MGYPTVMSSVQNVGVGANIDIRPPAFQSWRVTHLGSSIWLGVPPAQVPDLQVSLFDGILQAHFLRGTDIRGWHRVQNLMIDNTNYMRVQNTGGAQASVSVSAELVRYSGTRPSIVESDLQNVGIGANFSIQPPINEDWIIYDFCSDQWIGAAPAGLPNMTVDLDNGVITAHILDSTEARQWSSEIKLPINNAIYLTMTNDTVAAAADMGWSGEIRRFSGTGMTVVRSAVQAVGAAANVDFLPPAGEEWNLYMIGSSAWVGISPAQLPNITAQLFNGVLVSALQDPVNWYFNDHGVNVKLENANYLRVNNPLGVGQNVGIAAELAQMYA